MNMEDKKKALNTALKQIDKSFGKGSVVRMGDVERSDIEAISTGSIGLNKALGIGGVPKGRIIEIYGPESSSKTTTALHIIAECQSQGGIAAFIDAEHALDPRYAEAIGVDVDNLYLSQPMNGGEEALDILETLVRSGAVDVVVVDSVAALTPKVELEGEMTDQQVGVQARMMSKALRKLTGIISQSKCTVIFINQIRMKIGMMGYGCFHYDTLVNFVDGRSIPIGKVVDEKIQGDVYTINEKTNKIEIKPILDWQDNGKVKNKEDFLHIQTSSIDGAGRFGFTCTLNHEILTNSGWKQAKNLDMNDKLISRYESKINGTLLDFMAGVLVGDSSISIRDKNTGRLKLQDNENLDYIDWKISKLKCFSNFKEVLIKRGSRFDSESSYELAKLTKEINGRDPMFLINNFSFLGLAVWIMDDGLYDSKDYHNRYKISIKRFKNDEAKLLDISIKLAKSIGIKKKDISIHVPSGSLNFTSKATSFIAEKIKTYIPDSMQYKLPKNFRGFYKDFELSFKPEIKTEEVSIKLIREASDRQMRNKRKFDLTIEDNHNYMVGGINNGVIVHNSPETTTGGNGLKFYASVRIDVRRISTLKNGEDQIGIRVKAKVIKNKVAAPFKLAEYDVIFGKGISMMGEVIDYGIKYDIIDKAGAWFSYGDIKIGQGREKVKDFLEKNPDIFMEIKAKIEESLKPQIILPDEIEEIKAEEQALETE